MKRTTVFLTDDIEQLLREAAQRTRRSQAEIVREALTQYLQAQTRPWPRSVGIGNNPDPAVTSENVSEWVHAQWRKDITSSDTEPDSSPC